MGEQGHVPNVVVAAPATCAAYPAHARTPQGRRLRPCGVIQLGADVLRLHVCSPAACREAHILQLVAEEREREQRVGAPCGVVPVGGEMYCNTCLQACIHSEPDTTYHVFTGPAAVFTL